jgi:hypothetical protein
MNENMRYLKEEQKFLEKARAEGISPACALREVVSLMVDDFDALLDDNTGD